MSASAETAPELAELRLAIRATETGFEAQVLEAPLRGYAREPFALPLDHAELQAFWQRVTGGAADSRTWQDVGGRLFASLFDGALAQAFERTRLAHQRLRVRLVFHAQDVSSRLLSLVPWEGLWDDEERRFLGARRSMPLVRQIDGGNRPRHGLSVEPPLRVLPVIAAPKDQGSFPLDIGEPAVRAGLAPLLEAKEAILLPAVRGTQDRLRDALLEHQPHVLHFLGHGAFESDRGMLALETEDGATDLVEGEYFAHLLQDVESLRLVVLVSCQTSLFGALPYLGLTSAMAVYTEVPATVAMQSFLGFDAAEIFTRSLYKRLAARDDVDVAVSEARATMARRSAQWLLPALFMSSPNGRLLPPKVSPTKAASGRLAVAAPAVSGSAAPPTASAPEPPLRLGVRSMEPLSPELEALTDRQLNLVEFFDRRDIREPRLWQDEVYPRLAEFLLTAAAERRRLKLFFAAHQTLAFAAGWVLQAKSGLDVSFLQGGRSGPPRPWSPADRALPDHELWLDQPDRLGAADAEDVAIALGLTHSIATPVAEHLAEHGTIVHRLIPAEVAPQAGPTAVLGGGHALRLADAIAYRAMQRTPQERRGTLHLFAAAPNAFLFYLGQLARPFGRIQLYEYGFDETKWPGEYVPSLVLPPTGA
jgi:hypothetical protein